MNSPYCCQKNRRACDDARCQESWLIRAKQVAGFILPSTLLTLLPKCPMCLAAYVALGTGFTMSYTSAQIFMRTSTVLCIGTLALCVVQRLVNCGLKKQASNPQPTPVRC
jgi:hypothetical protein